MSRRLCLPLLLCVLFCPLAANAARVTLFALFKDKAILQVDETRRMLAAGETSPEGIRLISTDTRAEEAVVERDGKRETLKLGVVATAFESGPRESAVLYAGEGGHFFANGSINDQPVQFLVDTGATSVSLSGRQASSLGIDYKRFGKTTYSETASGVAPVYVLRLQKVKIGDATLRNVEAAVIEGDYPTTALLGMSFLEAFEMKRAGNRMELIRRY